MNIRCLTVGPVQANCWIVWDEQTGEGFAVDPGADSRTILRFLKENGIRLCRILLTHEHFDHIGACEALRRACGAQVCATERAAAALGSAVLSGYCDFIPSGEGFVPAEADVLLHDGDRFTAAGCEMTVISVPGHSPGSCCYDTGEWLFTGDTLFAGTCGRTDLYGGNAAELLHSLHRIACLEGERTVLPGHMERTTLERERTYNFAVRQAEACSYT